MKDAGFAVICLECGKRFTTRSMLPTCPRCGGSDIEPAPRQLTIGRTA
jgi:predicted  nucleic acid-binding Zn-ribbon protein